MRELLIIGVIIFSAIISFLILKEYKKKKRNIIVALMVLIVCGYVSTIVTVFAIELSEIVRVKYFLENIQIRNITYTSQFDIGYIINILLLPIYSFLLNNKKKKEDKNISFILKSLLVTIIFFVIVTVLFTYMPI